MDITIDSITNEKLNNNSGEMLDNTSDSKLEKDSDYIQCMISDSMPDINSDGKPDVNSDSILEKNSDINSDKKPDANSGSKLKRWLENKSALEKERIENMKYYESDALHFGYSLIAGIDEVGRGPLAGPVVSAAVILDESNIPAGINDSKIISEKKRERLFDAIKSSCISYGIGIVSEKIVDEINILNATKLSMKLAVESMRIQPDFLLVDAVFIDNISIPQRSIIKGDKLSISIAAASILAKVCRDRIMVKYDEYYPGYGFARHKGYGTMAHIATIKKFGISPIHRVTFVHL